MKKEKTGGRKAGTPNKTTLEMRGFMQSFLGEKFEKLDEVFEQLEPKDKMSAIIKMLPYLLPKQMQMDLTATHQHQVRQDLSQLTDEELHKLIEINEKITPIQINK